MRLTKLRVSGFKSFVDPTVLTVPADIVGIVGPNGCGKSNVIDAVRWVMGEASAKTLRGDSMADVIFNGSTSRKPVGKASVELIFENDKGDAPAAYSQFTEISVRRTLERDGLSEYFLNNSRCRRRDITDLFHGTGLGPRSYSIIEQGMVSRIIEARPEDLRSLVEEAAGISRYKDRRRETETRIRHTRENLDRVNDIRQELDVQLRRLKRQSRSAQRYKELKQEHRSVQAQLLAIRWRDMSGELSAHDRQLAQLENELQSVVAAQRSVESDLETTRKAQGEAQQDLNNAQGEFYRVGAEVATVEQAIEHQRENRVRHESERDRLAEELNALDGQLEHHRMQLHDAVQRRESVDVDLSAAAADHEQAQLDLAQAERDYQTWQEQWELLNERAIVPAQQRERHEARTQQLGTQLAELFQRIAELGAERTGLEARRREADPEPLRAEASELESAAVAGERRLAELDDQIQQARRALDQAMGRVDATRSALHQASSRLESLQALQDAALGEDDEAFRAWLEQGQLQHRPRLADLIRVDPGWERAADVVLGNRLAAVCVSELNPFAAGQLPDNTLTLIESGAPRGTADAESDSLASKIHCPEADLSVWLAGITTVNGLEEAMDQRASLSGARCYVTADGVVVGRNWLRSAAPGDGEANLLQRADAIRSLEQHLESLRLEFASAQDAARLQRELVARLDGQHARARSETRHLAEQRAELNSRLGRHEALFAELGDHCRRLENAEAQTRKSHQECVAALEESERDLAEATHRHGSQDEQRRALLGRRDALQLQVRQQREQADACRDRHHALTLEQHRLGLAADTERGRLAQLAQQRDAVGQRRAQVQADLAQGDAPEQDLGAKLRQLLDERVVAETRLSDQRDALAHLEEQLRAQADVRRQHEQRVTHVRETMDAERMARQERAVRVDTVRERIVSDGFVPEDLVRDLDSASNEEQWREKLELLEGRIERIGPVNLVAIEEFEEQSERKTYLDRQHEDLSQALETLETVIRRIDRETRIRFKETFEKLNEGFGEFFPRLFGGGQATLSLTDDDMLETGVSVMARPPGKRNSTIHLLSGGEKALTAVALLFSFFQLQPAPFCLLDEVDAPLDDTNVVRYCETLKSLARHTQLLFITHNKITMEFADILIGVTMGEPGVSRLVSVDIEQALEMATA